MKQDDFEQKVQRQTLRSIPAAWREEILSAACAAGTARRAVRRRRSAASLPDWIQSLLWPHPKAWAGLAAAWVLILVLNFTTHGDKARSASQAAAPLSPAVVAELKQQQRMLAELIGSREPPDADRSKSFVPLPRSERTEIMSA